MKYLLSIFLALSSLANAAALVMVDESLPITDTFMGSRLTNVGTHNSLYPHANLGLAVNCHPYDPTTVKDSDAPACASHPLIVNYAQEQSCKFLPEPIQKILGALEPSTKVYLNVQDNPWNGTPIEVRAHAFSDFFPDMGAEYKAVNVLVYRDDGKKILDEAGSVHLHDGIASPDNFVIPGLDHEKNESFYSVVSYNGKSVLTRHILLTVKAREQFQDCFCVKAPEDRSAASFARFLGDNYQEFL